MERLGASSGLFDLSQSLVPITALPDLVAAEGEERVLVGAAD
jgi:hypothetical protein